MKRLALFLSCSAALAFGTDLASVKNVYLLKMQKGMDQYLANSLTNEHLFQIVTDPKLADAIWTDQIGEGFEAKMAELFPPPEPEEKPEKAAKPEKDADPNVVSMMSETVNKVSNPASGSFGRAKGTLFLVDAKSKEVVWSTYDPPKDSTSKQLDRTANDIVSRLKRDLKKK
jgi:hypothetical protein